MNAIEILLSDHKKIKEMIMHLLALSESDAEQRNASFAMLKHEMKIHEKLEEDLLYPHLMQFAASRANAFEHNAEVNVLENLLMTLSKAGTHTEEWTAQFRVFSEINEHHFREEESTQFSQILELLPADILEEIGDKMLTLKTKVQVA